MVKLESSKKPNAPILLVGLGNPGKKYEETRHNAGFMAIDEIIDFFDGKFSTGVNSSNMQKKFNAEFAKINILVNEENKRDVIFLKPQTYMNLSGGSVNGCAKFFKIPAWNIIVFYDDLDLKIGKVRVKQAGGHGGHNGIKSIDSCFGKNYFRVKIGIDRPQNSAVDSYVLNKFTEEQKQEIEGTNQKIAKNIDILLNSLEQKSRDLFMTKIAL